MVDEEWEDFKVSSFHSLWIVPTGKALDTFVKINKELSQKYDAPIFEPHMTLIGNLEINQEECLQKSGILASLIKPFSIRFKIAKCLDKYYRCVFAKADESAQLINAAKLAKQIFYDNGEEFIPHISLLYGDYSMDLRKTIVKSLNFDVEFMFEKLIVTNSSKFSKISDWKIIEEIKLGE